MLEKAFQITFNDFSVLVLLSLFNLMNYVKCTIIMFHHGIITTTHLLSAMCQLLYLYHLI